jgi:predicted RNase H-like nuclease (RuvC/YqgF family)
LRCGKIGGTAGKASKIHVGIDFTVQKEIEKAAQELRLLSAKIEKLKTLISAGIPETERYAKRIDVRDKLNVQIQNVSAKIDLLHAKVNVDENATVEILGEISPGTLIEICQVALFVDKPLRHTRFRLDKQAGRVVQSNS